VCTVSFAVSGEDITKYHLKEFNTVEEFKEAYLNKVITYAPVEKYISLLGYSSLSQQMNLDFRFRNFLVTSITGKTKKNKDTQDMEWTIKEVDGYVTKTFKVHTGNYTKKISYYNSDSEFLFKDLQFFALGAWKEDHKSEIGKVFENPLVKAKYEVTDVSLSIEEDKDDYKKKILKFYTVKNTISGKESKYVAAKARTLCFEEDLSGGYVSTLAKVEKPSNPSVKYGKTTTVEDKGITKYSYEDNFISIIIFGSSTKFSFTLKNVSQNSLKLLWDDAVFVDYKGSTSKVMHSGIRYSQREASQPASTIIKGASLDDIACPTSNVRYSDVLKEWVTESMYPSGVTMDTKQVQLMLPIQIKDVVNEYIFVFNINYKYRYPERLKFPEIDIK
jgi:hypothetical protein